MFTIHQIFFLTILTLSVISSGPRPLDEISPPIPACIIRYHPSFHLRPTDRRPIILTPPCQLWNIPRTPEPVMRFF